MTGLFPDAYFRIGDECNGKEWDANPRIGKFKHGQDSLAQAAHGGNRSLLSWGYYLDLNEPASHRPLEGSPPPVTARPWKCRLM